MRIAVPQETAPGERRVALVPESCKKLVQAGYEVSVETDAGRDAGYSDAAYREAGATIETDRSALVSGADILLKVGPPARDEVGWLRAGAIYLGSLGQGTHDKVERCDIWRFPADKPKRILEVCPPEPAGPWRDCDPPPAGTKSVVMISDMTQ